jgi:transcriptional regulator with XRE-family HTH domain
MKQENYSEKLLIEEIAEAAKTTRKASRGLAIGSLIKLVRTQLRMSQAVLSKRAGIPQSTVSRIEQGRKESNLSTLNKILDALSCDLIIVPLLREPPDMICRKQARKKAETHLLYLKGTMSLEGQQLDTRFLEGFLKQEEERLLYSTHLQLWE